MKFRFDDLEIDSEQFELRRSGELVPVEPLIFDLLVWFVKNPNTIYSRDELMDSVWAGRLVSDATISSAVKHARKALGDTGTKQRYIKTVHGRGFRFDGTVMQQEAAPLPSAPVHKPPIAYVNPTLLLLPNKTFGSRDSYNGLVNDLISHLETTLTRIPLLNISSEASRYSARESAPSPKQLSAEIGVDYLVEVNHHQDDSGTKINIQLTNANAGLRIWAHSFTYPLTSDGHQLDQIVADVISKLEPQLNKSIYQYVQHSNEDQDARQLYLKASGLLAIKGWHENTFLEAADLLRQSAKVDPEFALAPAYLSLLLAFGHRVGLLTDKEQARIEAISAANTALELDNSNSTVLGFTGCALADVGMTERGVPLLKNAIALNPANGQAWVALGAADLMQKNLKNAIYNLEHGIKISPMDSRLSIWQSILAVTYIFAKDLDKASLNAEKACEHDDKTYMPRLALAAVRLLRSDLDGAATALSEAYRVKPDLSAAEIDGLLSRRLRKALQSATAP